MSAEGAGKVGNDIGVALLQGGFGLGGIGASYALGRSSSKKQANWAKEQQIRDHKMALEQMGYQTALQKSLMQYQNEYNSPASQAQRYREAGFNPALAIQQPNISAGGQVAIGSGGSGSSPHMSDYSSAFGRVFDLIGMLNGLANIEKTEQEASNAYTDKQIKSEILNNIKEFGTTDMSGNPLAVLGGSLTRWLKQSGALDSPSALGRVLDSTVNEAVGQIPFVGKYLQGGSLFSNVGNVLERGFRDPARKNRIEVRGRPVRSFRFWDRED